MLLAPVAHAHQFWLVAHDGVTRQGEGVVFELRIGPTWPGVQSPRLPNLVDWFKAADALGVRDVEGRDGSLSVGHFSTRSAGATVVAMRTNSAYIKLPADEFNQYLKEEGLSAPQQLRKRYGLENAPGRESYSRCAKSIVLVDGQSQGFDRQMNLPLELVPRTDPLAVATGRPFTVELLFDGAPLPGALVKAQRQADPAGELTAITDARGRVSLPLPGPGLWLFNAVHMEPSGEDGADWESLWASMTIDMPLEGGSGDER